MAVNLSSAQSQGQAISFAVAMFVNNLASGIAAVFQFAGGFNVTVGAGKQAWIPIVCQNPIAFTVGIAGGGTTFVTLVNYDVEPAVW